MEHSIADIIPMAVAVALSPMPIAALLLILLSKKAKINSIGFLVGWLIGLFFIVFLSITIINSSVEISGSGRHIVRDAINGGLGMLLILFALKQFSKRPKPGETPKMPKWMSAIENFNPIKSFSVGFLLSTINFKNTPMGIAAGTALAQHAPTSLDALIGMTGYVLIGGTTVIVPVIGFLLLGQKLQHEFETLKNWLIYNNATIMFVIFLLLGVDLLAKALKG